MNTLWLYTLHNIDKHMLQISIRWLMNDTWYQQQSVTPNYIYLVRLCSRLSLYKIVLLRISPATSIIQHDRFSAIDSNYRYLICSFIAHTSNTFIKMICCDYKHKKNMLWLIINEHNVCWETISPFFVLWLTSSRCWVVCTDLKN